MLPTTILPSTTSMEKNVSSEKNESSLMNGDSSIVHTNSSNNHSNHKEYLYSFQQLLEYLLEVDGKLETIEQTALYMYEHPQIIFYIQIKLRQVSIYLSLE